jgi:hypothetical protein
VLIEISDRQEEAAVEAFRRVGLETAVHESDEDEYPTYVLLATLATRARDVAGSVADD